MNNRTTIMIALLAVMMIAGAANTVATDVIGDGAVVNETVSTASASEISSDNDTILEAAYDPHYFDYEGATTCTASCHDASGFVTSIHNTWLGTATNVVGKEGMETGKLVAVNEFCGAIASNEAMCGKCHAGHGLIEGDFSAEKIDCLICHAPDYAKTATGSALSIDATTAAARNVTAPTREMCLRCHAGAGGGDNRKRGDIEFNMTSDIELEMMSNPKPAVGDLDAAMGATDVPRDLDVHMNKGMTCQDCHEFEDHHVPGRGMDLRVDDTDTVLSCDNCHRYAHSGSSAVDSFIKDKHMDRISCTVCHITSYGKETPVEVARNWELTFAPGMLTKESNPAPIQVWWNRKSEILDLADPVVFDSNGDVIMAKPVGDISDPTSKIYAARLHRGRSPWDGSTYMLSFHVPTASATKNMTQAIFNATGETYDPVMYVNSTRYMGIFHGVSPKEDALTCSDCHEDHKLDFEALGYDNIEKDASGNLTRATKPGGAMNLVNLSGLDHDDMISEYKGAETCLMCHSQIGEDFVDSIHNTWMGTATNVVGKEDMETGKLVGVNEFCVGITSNEELCGKCHAGYGLIEGDFSAEKIDCLTCHAPGYTKTTATGPDPLSGATAAAKNVTLPTREMCLRCHATAGGGDNNKRGDVELGMKSDLENGTMSNPKPVAGDLDAAMGATDVSRDLDVHMGANMTCQQCHIFEDHHVSGRGMDLRIDDTDTLVSCDDAECHSSAPHKGTSIEDALNNMHTDKLACTVCHITSYGKETTVEMSRDWSNRSLDAKNHFNAYIAREDNPAPIQVWWNRKSKIMDLADPAVLDSDGVVVMAEPVGEIGDSDSKIYAARLHLGKQPWDGTYMLPFRVRSIWADSNMTQAIFDATDVMYDPVEYVDAKRYMGIFHGVAPSEDALTCIDCHDRSRHKLDYEALGYDVEYDEFGNLTSATKPGGTLNLATFAEGATDGSSAVQINSWTLPSAGTRGTSISATVNIANTGTGTDWFVVSISGAQPTTGYPIVSLGTVELGAGATKTVPVMVAVPGSADTGSYTLTPVVYKLDDYPAGDPQAIGSGKSVTIS